MKNRCNEFPPRGIIVQLTQQKAAIEKALAALHSLDGGVTVKAAAPAPAKRKGGIRS